MTHKNNIPIYAEEQIINEETASIQKILNQFKQPIPTNYIKLKVEEGNYMGSTNPKWKDKPVSERYGFYLEEEEEKWVQIDIPRELMETLEIAEREDINYPLYLNPSVLKEKRPIRGAYTIENEEVFINKPVSEKNVEKELVKRMKSLRDLRKKVEELEKENKKLQERGKEFWILFLLARRKLFKAEKKIGKLEEELQKELSWWDKWMNDERGISDKGMTSCQQGNVNQILYSNYLQDFENTNLFSDIFSKEEIENIIGGDKGYKVDSFGISFYFTKQPDSFGLPNKEHYVYAAIHDGITRYGNTIRESRGERIKKGKEKFKKIFYEYYKNK
jgi:hypothetical protein